MGGQPDRQHRGKGPVVFDERGLPLFRRPERSKNKHKRLMRQPYERGAGRGEHCARCNHMVGEHEVNTEGYQCKRCRCFDRFPPRTKG